MFTDKLPNELISIDETLFSLVSETYDSRRSDANRVREIFEKVVFKDQADADILISLGNSERNKFINLRALYTKSKCQLAFRNLFIQKLRVFDENQPFYASLKDESKSKVTLKSENTLESQTDLVIPAVAMSKEQTVSQFASKRIQAPAPHKTDIDPDEAYALQLQAELLEEEEKVVQKKARTSNEGAEVEIKKASVDVPAAAAKPSFPTKQEDEIELYQEQEDTEPVEPIDDFALALKLVDDWNNKGIDPLDALKSKSVKKDQDFEFLEEMETANAIAIAKLYEADIRANEQAVQIPSIEAIQQNPFVSSFAPTHAASSKVAEFEWEDVMNYEGFAQAKKLNNDAFESSLAQPDENLSRRMAAEAARMSTEMMNIPGVGHVQRTPSSYIVDSKSNPYKKLYVRDRVVIDSQTTSVRLECSVGNEMTIHEDCQIEIVDIQFGTIYITKSKVKIHNASDCNIIIKHNSKVTLTGQSLNNVIKYSKDSELDMSQELWNGNTITHS